MGIEVPEFVKSISPWVLGPDWRKGDETAVLRLADAWDQAAQDIEAAMTAAEAAVREARGHMEGEGAQAFDSLWARFAQGDEAAFAPLKSGSEQLTKACRTCPMQIEYATLSLILSQTQRMSAAT
jgi:hypothetical protein